MHLEGSDDDHARGAGATEGVAAVRVLSLFSGIGGLDLAAEWAGMETVAFCEIEEYPVQVLKRRWPDVPVYNDVRELTRERLEADGILPIDIITGGFPCQDVSQAGRRVGFHDQDGEITRSGLWTEYARLIGEIKPRWVVAENVRGLLSNDADGNSGGTFGIVLRDLADLGYRAGWCCYGVCDVGGVHQRDRVFIIAYSNIYRLERDREKPQKTNGTNYFQITSSPAINAAIGLWNTQKTNSDRVRANDGVSHWMDRLKCLGNAVVPQQAYPIFKAIMEVEA